MAAAEAALAPLSRALADAGVSDEAGALVVPPEQLIRVLRWLRDEPDQAYDMLSSLTAIDYLPAEAQARQPARPGRFEVVYHLCSTVHRRGPIALKCRTASRVDPHLPSVTDLYRGAEFQEREAYDLFGIVFDGHPDLRRILMWEGFADHPMRKDYRPPDDHEWEPTSHLEEEEARETGKRASGSP